MKGLDYSKFKKVSSTSDHTVLKHKDGHELKIAHKGLSSKHKEDLHRLPMAKGGEVRKYAEGDVVAKPEEFTPGKDYSQEPLPGDPTSTPVPPPEPQVHDKKAMVEALKGKIPYSEVPSSPVEDSTQPPPQTPLSETQPEPTSQELAPSQPAPETPKQELQAEEKTKNPAWAAEDTKLFLDQEDLNFQNDLQQGHIQPHNYGELFDRKDTLGKVSSVFGLLLSTAGSLLSLNPAPLMNFMDREINRDLQAQVKSNENAQNWYRLNQQNLKNMADVSQTDVDTNAKAWALSQSQMFQSSYHNLTKAVAKMPEGQQKQQGQQMLAMLYPHVAQKIQNVNDLASSAAEYQKLLFGGNQPSGSEAGFKKQVQGLRMLGPEGEQRAKELESKHYPGFEGQASIPLTAEDRDKLEAGTNFDQKLQRFTKWAKGHSGSLDPKAIMTGRAMAAELQSAYREAIHGGVYKAGEQSFIGNIIDDDPTKFFNKLRVIPKLEAVSKEHLAKMNNFAKSKGFEKYSPGTESDEETKVVNGVKYRRGPNGEAVRVQ